MSKVFLGPLLHWVIVISLIALGWISGKFRVHVSDFNPFIIVLIAIVVVTLVVVLATSRPGMRVTRDPVEEGAPNDPDAG